MSRIQRFAAGAIILLLSSLNVTSILSQTGRNYDEWAESPESWPNQGGGISNRREASFVGKISKESLDRLKLKWTAPADFYVSATPSIDSTRNAVYFSSWDGCQYAVKMDTGELIWKANLTEIAPTIPGLVEGLFIVPGLKLQDPALVKLLGDVLSRPTPTIAGPLLVFGILNPCFVLALDRFSGALVWWSSLDSHPYCVFTQSGTYHNGSFYIGTSSLEEGAPPQLCCTFQGAFFKLDAKTGEILWRVPMLPDNHQKQGGYAGASVWGSSPSIDVDKRLVYIGSGNLYQTPPDVEACENARLSATIPKIPDPCLHPDDHDESILAIDIDTGNISWATHLGGYDVWFVACGYGTNRPAVRPPNCPEFLGPDFDFGEAPFLLTIKEQGKGPGSSSSISRDIVVAGQKSGIVHALDRTTGEIVWQTQAGPGGIGGGASWGMSTDGERVFTNSINTLHLNFTLLPSSKVITWGGWVGLNASTGAILWSTANPDQFGTNAPVAYANGVVFGASTGNATGTPLGKIVALDAITGDILWEYTTQGGISGGVSIMDGCIFQPVGVTLLTFGLSVNTTAPNEGRSTISLCVS